MRDLVLGEPTRDAEALKIAAHVRAFVAFGQPARDGETAVLWGMKLMVWTERQGCTRDR